MFNPLRYRALLHFKAPKHRRHFRFPFCTTTSDSESESDSESRSFTVSYLVNNVGLSPEAALKASKRHRFTSSQRPDSVSAFFRSHGFSDTNIRHIVDKEPALLSWDPRKSILPKLVFFLSKGAAPSDITRMISVNPRILKRSLDNHIIPMYELLHRFLRSDEDTITFIIRHSIPLSFKLTGDNIKLLIDYGVCDLGITRLLLTRPSILGTNNLVDTLEEVKGLGFDPSKSTFSRALLARKAVGQTRWDEKVGAFKKWGWSYEAILRAFRIQPDMMLVSCEKINLLMDFWVDKMGWDALALVRGPMIFGYSFPKRVVPRASVVEFLLTNGLRNRNASLITPFAKTEKIFLNKFVLCFEKESSLLLKLYKEKLSLAYQGER
ncbi:hypothetical protein RJT34_14725 [Clitoria ternatea]|uniref:Transcription regulator mTERF family n=1 Tax=Clitoria ternatea TaxID=43366 RepID=A0AAN9JTD4_CLITE